MLQRPSTRAAAIIAALLLVTTVPATVVANHQNNNNVEITSPASGATFTRLDAVQFVAHANTRSGCTGSTSWDLGDGSTASGLTATRTYGSLGAFVVKVTHTTTGSCSGAGVKNATITINIANIAPVARIAAPATVVAGQTLTLDASASTDADGSIALYTFRVDGVSGPSQASPTLAIAPTLAGTHTAAVTVGDNNGGSNLSAALSFQVLAAALDSIVVSPSAATLAAAGSQGFTAAGFDAYGNAVAVTPAWTASCGSIDGSGAYVAPTAVGACTVQATSGAVSGSATVSVVAGPLDSIAVSGPASVVAGTSASFDLAGSDSYGNPVPLAQASLGWLAPTAAGPQTVSYTEGGVTGSTPVSVVPDALATLSIDGPATLVAGATASYALSGVDQYGNAVELSESSLVYTASIVAGDYLVCHTEDDVSECIDVSVIADALAQIVVSGSDSLVAGTTGTYGLAGFDQHGNAVGLSQASLDFDAPTAMGTATVSYTESDVTGQKEVQILADALATISITGVSEIVAGTTETYSLAGSDQYGNPVVLAQSTLDHTAPTLVGADTVSYTEQGVTGTKAVTVVHDVLATIVVSGPSSLVAGTVGSYHADGFDQYGNDVPLAAPDFDATAQTIAGSQNVCYEESEMSGCMMIAVTPDALASIVVSGPAQLVAGTSASFALAGYDQYLNVVELAESVLDYDAPTAVGPVSVCYAEDEVEGCAAVTIVPDALASIEVAGPATVVAGTSEEYSLSGFDQHGNAVALAQPTVTFDAPNAVGGATVSYTESGVTGSQDVTIVPDALASIALAGPTEMVAGTSATFTLSGADQYGNAVALSVASVDHAASTSVGTDTVSYTEDGVTGSATIAVVADVLDSIEVTGPDTIVAGTSQSYAVAGFDQYGNGVGLAATSVIATAGTIVGTMTVSYSEGGITGSETITIVPAALATIAVTGVNAMPAGSTGVFGVAGSDQYGNAVQLAVTTVSHIAGQSVGTEVVSYSEQGVTGSKTITITPVALALSVQMSQAAYAPADALLTGISGTATVRFPGAGTMEGAAVQVVVLRTVRLVGYVQSETFVGTTDADGTFTFTPSAAFSLVGDYVVIVRANALGNAGITTGSYRVGL